MEPPLPAASAATTDRDDPRIWRIDDAPWALPEPILGIDKPRKKPGRPRRDDRAILPPPGHPDRRPPRRRAVEVAHGRFNRFRRVLTRTETRASHDRGIGQIAAVPITSRKVRDARLRSG